MLGNEENEDKFGGLEERKISKGETFLISPKTASLL